ncbi:PP2C family serine/threonine-protein phosphatase [Halomicronema sp. CCY15110]|uniref:PP2C family protein-serine/threonine phosphatase n=1 Tax=Halomicronema sp. CCY15110 TaxID=2767773 RepID=UPI00194E24EC|nr:protein phosphatase 2C domain-containing protein [Halomicronema sp. CCY15110]
MPNSQLPPIQRYLWAQGTVAAPLPAGSYLAQRYQVIRFPLVRDTQPQLPPPALADVPAAAMPYLVLSPYLTAMPRPVTQVSQAEGQPLLLLDEVPLRGQLHADAPPDLLPALTESWPQASAIEQLSWLWQLAQLWQPCLDQRVAHCLLAADLVRVDGEDVRLLMVTVDPSPLDLKDLGQHWQGLVNQAAPTIRDYLTRLTQQLVAGQGQVGGLVNSLAQALQQQSAQQPCQVQWAVQSDQGPTRNRNEDACFPASGTAQTVQLMTETSHQLTPAPLLVVCDGIGGHEGGNIASQTAIAEVTQALQPLLVRNGVPHADLVLTLKQALLRANEAIAQRNDADHKRERGRMGTTIVLALVYDGCLYVAHLGDSRAYRVRSHNCRQLTLDDDIAVRDTRLGLRLYAEALQHPGAGALVQALGMAPTPHLHPTVQLFAIAADSLIVLCSDGLSDYDLVDQLWAAELHPVLVGDRDVGQATQRLVTLANTHNGHDNVTVGLLRVSPQVGGAVAPVPVQLVEGLRQAAPDVTAPLVTARPPAAAPTTLRPVPPPPAQPKNRWPLIIVSVLVAAGVGIIAALGWQWWQRRAPAPLEDSAPPSGSTLSPSAEPPTGSTAIADLAVGDYLQIKTLSDPTAAATLMTTPAPPAADAPSAVDPPKRLLIAQTVVRVRSRQQTPAGELWVRLQVCSTPTANPTVGSEAPLPPALEGGRPALLWPIAMPGDEGWVLQGDVATFAAPLLDTSSPQQGLCTD